MDAIKSVENEVDKVLRLFSDCRDSCNNKINQLIELVERAKENVDSTSSRKYLFAILTAILLFLRDF